MNPQMPDLRYPIGKFSLEGEVTRDRVAAWTDHIAALPGDLRRTVSPLTDGQLDAPYRPGGWTVRQVVHHLADSHMNSYIRFKLALTEDRPVIKAYDEKSWAEVPDCREPIASSLDLLAALHRRWVDLLRSLKWTRLQREFVHPESGAARLSFTVGIYAWHGRHHLAHIQRFLEREGWGAAVVRQANWHKIGGESPLKRKDEPSTFLREPCVGTREGVGEASVAVRMGRLLSIVSSMIGSAEAVIAVEGNTGRTDRVRGGRAPRCQRTHART